MYAGTASRTSSLVDSQGVVRTAAQFLASDSDDSTSGALSIRNNNGLTVGLTDNNVIKVTNLGVVSENNVSGENYIIRMTTSLGKRDAVTINSANNRVGIYNSNPGATLDVTGDMKISGDLTVSGSTTTIDSATLRVEDKNIELGLGSDSTLLNDTQVDSAGIIVKSSDGDKEFLWRQASNAWTTGNSINFTGTGGLKFNGVTIISGTEAPGITSIGNLTTANIGNISFTGGIGVSTGVVDGSGNGLNLTLAGNLNLVTPRKITGVAEPTAPTDVTTKNYVDTAIGTEVIALALDITGLGTGTNLNTNIATILQDIAPAGGKVEGCEARVHCTATTGATATLSAANLNASFNKSLVVVQQLDGSGNDSGSVSVIGDATFNDVTGAITSTVQRSLKLFRINGGSWGYVQDLTPGNLI